MGTIKYSHFTETEAGTIREFTCGHSSIKDPILDSEVNNMVPNPSSTVFPMGKKKKQRIMVLCGEHKGGGPLRAPPKRGALNPAEER